MSQNMSGLVLGGSAQSLLNLYNTWHHPQTMPQLTLNGGFTELNIITPGDGQGTGNVIYVGQVYDQPIWVLTETGQMISGFQFANNPGEFAVTIFESTGIVPNPGNGVANPFVIGFNTQVNGTLSVEPGLNLMNATTSGTVYWEQPFRGDYKVFIAALPTGYYNASSGTQSITFPVPFRYPPVLSVNNTGLNVAVTSGSLTFPANMTAASAAGILKVEGI